MSALGQKQTCAMHHPMSALLQIATAKADVCGANRQICFGPIADSSLASDRDSQKWGLESGRRSWPPRVPCTHETNAARWRDLWGNSWDTIACAFNFLNLRVFLGRLTDTPSAMRQRISPTEARTADTALRSFGTRADSSDHICPRA